VQEFNSKGEYLSQFGSKGSGNGQFYSPLGIAIDSTGNLWVADNNYRFQEFNSKGEYLTKFGTLGGGEGQFYNPADLAFDAAGNIWVTDEFGRVGHWVLN
jgi:tripartite motif-containing protein 71